MSMIQITCRSEAYTYNTYHMIKAFYPAAQAVCRVEEKASNYVTVLLENGRKIEVGAADMQAVDSGMEKEADAKRHMDVKLYRLLEEETGNSLSWGILTGVRPTKIAMKKLEEGMDEKAFVSWFHETYMVSHEKASLAWEIAGREKELLKRLDYDGGYSLYVGIPFCPTVCSYCSFSSGALTDWESRVDDYLDALLKELKFIAGKSSGKKLNTIYIGGGTPTTLSAGQLERLLRCIDENFSREHLLEYTVEAGRPDSITREKLEAIRRHGVTRISINPQSMQQKTLDAIGRRHSVEQIITAYGMARELGFDNINMDIIAGLPGEGHHDMEDTLEQIRRLKPDSLTVHSLAIKRAARMDMEDMKLDDGKTNEVMSGMIRSAERVARQMGLSPYYLYRQKNIAGNFENVGYAKVDKAGIYNILIMEEKQSIVAAGAGASTKIVLKDMIPMPGSRKKKMTRLMRIENVKAIDAYIDRIDEMIERKGEWLWR